VCEALEGAAARLHESSRCLVGSVQFLERVFGYGRSGSDRAGLVCDRPLLSGLAAVAAEQVWLLQGASVRADAGARVSLAVARSVSGI
jgi:hypothetical protein